MCELHHFSRQEWRVGGEEQERDRSCVLGERSELERREVEVVELSRNSEAVGRPSWRLCCSLQLTNSVDIEGKSCEEPAGKLFC